MKESQVTKAMPLRILKLRQAGHRAVIMDGPSKTAMCISGWKP